MKTKLIAVEIPAKYKWMAQDGNGALCIFTHKPRRDVAYNQWMPSDGEFMQLSKGAVNPDWRDTLERIVEIEYV